MLFAPQENNPSLPINALADLFKMAYPAMQAMGDQNAGLEIHNLQDLLTYLEQAEQFLDEDITPFYHTYLAQLKEVLYGQDF